MFDELTEKSLMSPLTGMKHTYVSFCLRSKINPSTVFFLFCGADTAKITVNVREKGESFV